MWSGRARVGAEPRPVSQVARQHRREIGRVRGDHPARPDGVDLPGARRVRQPLEPVPRRQAARPAQYADGEVVRRVERRRVADHRAGQRPRALAVTEHLDAVELAKVQAGGEVRLGVVHRHQTSQRSLAGGVHLVDRGALGQRQLGRQRLVAHTEAHVQEPVVGTAQHPDPGSFAGQRGERRRLRVVPRERATLLRGRGADDLAHVCEVVEVVAAAPRDVPGTLLALAVDLHQDEAERGEQEQPGGEQAAAARCAGRTAHGRDQLRSRRGCRASDRVHQYAPAPSRGQNGGGGSAIWPPGISGACCRALLTVVLTCPPMVRSARRDPRSIRRQSGRSIARLWITRSARWWRRSAPVAMALTHPRGMETP